MVDLTETEEIICKDCKKPCSRSLRPVASSSTVALARRHANT